jgi:hypothetical protein
MMNEEASKLVEKKLCILRDALEANLTQQEALRNAEFELYYQMHVLEGEMDIFEEQGDNING